MLTISKDRGVLRGSSIGEFANSTTKRHAARTTENPNPCRLLLACCPAKHDYAPRQYPHKPAIRRSTATNPGKSVLGYAACIRQSIKTNSENILASRPNTVVTAAASTAPHPCQYHTQPADEKLRSSIGWPATDRGSIACWMDTVQFSRPEGSDGSQPCEGTVTRRRSGN
jgi:hypothetical protein